MANGLRRKTPAIHASALEISRRTRRGFRAASRSNSGAATGVLPFPRRPRSKQGAEPMSSSQAHPFSIRAFTAPLGAFGPATEYMVDAAQRSVLFWDVMRQRGNQYREHLAETVPN